MEKRYQVFISSTSVDLQDARQEVSQALLRSDCFPAQMEQWPATDEEQFEFIKQIINQCDYYIVISAGMYGSIHPDTGLSYTEMEFDYAMELGIPTIRLLHKDPLNSLSGSKIENTKTAKTKLIEFRQKLLDGKMCAFWETPTELGREVILSLNDIKKRKPKDGWVKASQMSSSDALVEISELRSELSEIKLRQNNGYRSIDVAGVLDRLDGFVTLTRYDHKFRDHAVSFDPEYDNQFYTHSINYRFTDFCKTSEKYEFTISQFSIKLLYGLLFHQNLDNAIRRVFASVETGESGYPTYILNCDDKNSLEDTFMTLESQGVILAGEKYNDSLFDEESYASSYPWNLTDAGREWIVSNKPKFTE